MIYQIPPSLYLYVMSAGTSLYDAIIHFTSSLNFIHYLMDNIRKFMKGCQSWHCFQERAVQVYNPRSTRNQSKKSALKGKCTIIMI